MSEKKAQAQSGENETPIEAPEAMEMPSQDQISEWKKKYGTLELNRIGGRLWIYRQLLSGEFRSMREKGLFNQEDNLVNHEIVKSTLVWPSYASVEWDREGAGTLDTLANAVTTLSGFVAAGQPVKL